MPNIEIKLNELNPKTENESEVKEATNVENKKESTLDKLQEIIEVGKENMINDDSIPADEKSEYIEKANKAIEKLENQKNEIVEKDKNEESGSNSNSV